MILYTVGVEGKATGAAALWTARPRTVGEGVVTPRLTTATGPLSRGNPQGHPQPVCTDSDAKQRGVNVWLRKVRGRLAGQSLLLDPVGQLSDLVVDRAALGHQGSDLAVGVHDRGVIPAAKLLADLGQRQVG